MSSPKPPEQQREHLEKFIHVLTNSKGVLPELMVEPEGLDNTESATEPETHKAQSGPEDPLLELFRRRAEFTHETFHAELRKQRGPSPRAAAQKASL